jgi:RNA polymerase sigma factor (sigma-70 family)
VTQHSVTHSTLLVRLRDAGDGGAWREFLDRYGDLIRGFCARRGLQAADVEDVCQDVMMSLTKAMGKFEYDPTRGLFRSYLKTVVVHAIAKRLCQRQASAGLSQAPDTSEGEEPWEQEWRQYHFRRAMQVIDSEFSESDRRAFRLYGVEGRAAAEVAERLGLSVESVYQAKSRVLRRLSRVIEQQVREEG